MIPVRMGVGIMVEEQLLCQRGRRFAMCVATEYEGC